MSQFPDQIGLRYIFEKKVEKNALDLVLSCYIL